MRQLYLFFYLTTWYTKSCNWLFLFEKIIEARKLIILVSTAERTDTTTEFFLKRKLINYTKNELQSINI